MTRAAALPHLDASNYARHLLHTEACIWPEKNCYIDIWIEVLHALGLDPHAALGFTIGVDFEDDQWTFFKPPHAELWQLYGIDVQELTVWKPLIEHAVEHLARGKLISTEADAFWLPDTVGTDYQHQHTKSTIVLNDIDVEAQRLGYFHNASYYQLEGRDFRSLFRLDMPPDPTFMPLYAEFIRADRRFTRSGSQLGAVALQLLRQHLLRRPADCPIDRFLDRMEAELPELRRRGLDYYHLWAFSTIRQAGSAFELAALHLRWLMNGTDLQAGAAADGLSEISSACKSLILKGARAVNAGRALDMRATGTEMSRCWRDSMAQLERALGL
jgi:hypothetical protein